MNERIRELERESGIELYGLGKDRAKWESKLEKFAELIIRECAEVVYSRSGLAQPQDLLEHFGVEE